MAFENITFSHYPPSNFTKKLLLNVKNLISFYIRIAWVLGNALLRITKNTTSNFFHLKGYFVQKQVSNPAACLCLIFTWHLFTHLHLPSVMSGEYFWFFDKKHENPNSFGLCHVNPSGCISVPPSHSQGATSILIPNWNPQKLTSERGTGRKWLHILLKYYIHNSKPNFWPILPILEEHGWPPWQRSNRRVNL